MKSFSRWLTLALILTLFHGVAGAEEAGGQKDLSVSGAAAADGAKEGKYLSDDELFDDLKADDAAAEPEQMGELRPDQAAEETASAAQDTADGHPAL